MSEFMRELHERAQRMAESCDPRDRAKIAETMKGDGRKGGVDVVRANALLSEFARDRRHTAALLTLDALLQLRPPRATSHTLAAFVNACASGGDPDLALSAVKALPQLFKSVHVGVVANTALVKALVGVGRLAEACEIVAQMPATGEDAPNARTIHALLRGALRTGDAAVARNALRRMRIDGHMPPDSTALEYAAKTLAHTGAVDEALALAAELDSLPGGALPSAIAAARLTIATTLALLKRVAEARASLGIARTSLEAPPAAMASVAATSEFQNSQVRFGEHQRRELRRDVEAVQRFLENSASTVSKKQFNGNSRVVVQQNKPATEEWRTALKILPPQRVLRVELCSGGGDWIVQHAVADGPNVLWAAVEILHDRAHSIWARAAMSGVDDRVAVLCADALFVLHDVIEPGSVDALFVNFPEPAPTGKTHFLHTATFAAAARKVLAPNARMIIVTDNRALAAGAAQVLSEVAFYGSVLSGNELPSNFGFRASYFDRLWANGNRVERHVIQAIKM